MENGKVRLPEGFEEAWSRFRSEHWGRIGIPESEGGVGLPYVATVAIQELFYGANPSFMTLSGFALPLYFLLQRYGSPELKRTFSEALLDNRFSACLCMTEPQAGSDIGAVTTRAHALDCGRYRLEGRKIFISAGSHELAENIVYVVLARIVGAPDGTPGLSCFLVPRFRIDGEGSDNFVRCLRLEEKMGLHGCPTAEMSFGDDGDCIGELLGEAPNRGLLQLLTMMNHARLATGVFGLGMASSAYLNAAEYAAQRVQGTNPRQVFNAAAPRVAIIEHGDVARMLLEMKTLVEGARALILTVAAELGRAQLLQANGGEKSEIARAEGLV
ncbi:MAG: acyl-CoA dehydrogenase family protein, partial [Rhodoferax sp.]